MADSPPTGDGFEAALNRAADAIAAERPERHRANRIMAGAIALALMLLVLLVVQGKLDRDERDRRAGEATAQRNRIERAAQDAKAAADFVRRVQDPARQAASRAATTEMLATVAGCLDPNSSGAEREACVRAALTSPTTTTTTAPNSG